MYFLHSMFTVTRLNSSIHWKQMLSKARLPRVCCSMNYLSTKPRHHLHFDNVNLCTDLKLHGFKSKAIPGSLNPGSCKYVQHAAKPIRLHSAHSPTPYRRSTRIQSAMGCWELMGLHVQFFCDTAWATLHCCFLLCRCDKVFHSTSLFPRIDHH